MTAAPAPQWLIDAIGKPLARAGKKCVVELLDTQPAIDRAIHHLKHEAASAFEGQNGDHATFKVACGIADYGISELTAFELMLEHWNPEKAHPPWDAEALATKVANAYRYRARPIGERSPQADFDPVPGILGTAAPTPQENKKANKLFLIEFSSATLPKDNPYLIKDVIDQEAMSVMYGESNSGKTFVMLDMAFHIATGKPWQNRKVSQGAVAYVALEGGRGITKRILALRSHHKADSAPLAVIPCPVDLLRPDGDGKALVALIRDWEADIGQKVKLVVIDTLSRAMAGGNENAPDDMTMFVAHCDALRNSLKAHVAIVHHTGKDKAKGARGHSSLRAATDTEIEIDAAGLINFTKQRDIEKTHSLGFALESVHLGVDSEGDAITSCVVIPQEASAAEDFKHVKERELSLAEKEVVDLVEEALRRYKQPGLSDAIFLDACELRNSKSKNLCSSDDQKARRRQYRIYLKNLVDKGGLARGEDGISLP